MECGHMIGEPIADLQHLCGNSEPPELSTALTLTDVTCAPVRTALSRLRHAGGGLGRRGELTDCL